MGNYRNNTKENIIIIGIIILNLIIKILFLDSRDIILDEAFTIFNSQRDLNSLFDIFINENNPPLHFLLVHFWIKLFGYSVFKMRLLSLIFSVSTIYLIYNFCLKFFNIKTAILSSLIFTFSTFHIYFSHELRVYSLFCFLIILILYHLFEIINKPDKLKSYILLAVFNSLLIYSHYLGIIILAIEFSVLMLFNKVIKNKIHYLMVFVFNAITFTPIIWIFIKRLQNFTHEGTWVPEPSISELYGNLNRFLNTKYVTIIILIIIIIGIIMVFKKNIYKKLFQEIVKDKNIQLIIYFFLSSYLGMYLISIAGYPIFLDRYILFTSIPFYIIIAIILHYLFENKKQFYFATLIIIISMLLSVEINPDNNRRIIELNNEVNSLRKNEPLLICPNYFDKNFMFYYNPEIFKNYQNFDSILKQNNIYPIESFSDLDESIINSDTIFYIDAASFFTHPNNGIIENLEENYKIELVKEFKENLFLYKFLRKEKLTQL